MNSNNSKKMKKDISYNEKKRVEIQKYREKKKEKECLILKSLEKGYTKTEYNLNLDNFIQGFWSAQEISELSGFELIDKMINEQVEYRILNKDKFYQYLKPMIPKELKLVSQYLNSTSIYLNDIKLSTNYNIDNETSYKCKEQTPHTDTQSKNVLFMVIGI